VQLLGRGLTRGPGVVDQDVEPVTAGDGLGHERLHRVVIGDIGLNGSVLAADIV